MRDYTKLLMGTRRVRRERGALVSLVLRPVSRKGLVGGLFRFTVDWEISSTRKTQLFCHTATSFFFCKRLPASCDITLYDVNVYILSCVQVDEVAINK